MANFYTYASDGNKTLSMICHLTGCNKSELITINNEEHSPQVTVGQYLQDLDLKGRKIPREIIIKIPVPLTGSIDTRFSAHSDLSALTTTEKGSDTKYNQTPLRDLAMRSTTPSKKNNSHSAISDKAANYFTGKNFDCSVRVLLDGRVVDQMELPVFPNEFSETNSPNFLSQGLLGRSVDYQIYQGSSRSASFTLNLHEELCGDYNYIHKLVAFIESAAYPGYDGGVVKVPEIRFTIGNQFSIRGILESCSATWKAPIIDQKLVNCDLSVSVKETLGPFSQSQVKINGGKRW